MTPTLTLTLTLTLTPSLTPSLIGTILERETVGKYALGKGAPVRDCRALTPVRNQVRGRDRFRVRDRLRVRVRVRGRGRVGVAFGSALLPPCVTRWLTAISRTS